MPAWVVGPSHVVPGQEAGSQGHAGGQNELEAGLAQYSQDCSEGAAAALQGTCMAAPTRDMASAGDTDTTTLGGAQDTRDLPLSCLAA